MVILLEVLAAIESGHAEQRLAVDDWADQSRAQGDRKGSSYRTDIERSIRVEDCLPMGVRPTADSFAHGNSD